MCRRHCRLSMGEKCVQASAYIHWTDYRQCAHHGNPATFRFVRSDTSSQSFHIYHVWRLASLICPRSCWGTVDRTCTHTVCSIAYSPVVRPSPSRTRCSDPSPPSKSNVSCMLMLLLFAILGTLSALIERLIALMLVVWVLLLSFQLRIRLPYRNEILTCDLSVLLLVDLTFYYPQTVCRAELLDYPFALIAYLVSTAFAYALLCALLVCSFTF